MKHSNQEILENEKGETMWNTEKIIHWEQYIQKLFTEQRHDYKQDIVRTCGQDNRT